MAARPDDTGAGRLIFLHGFTQTHHHWHPCAHLVTDRLGSRTTLAFADLPGHGLSAGDDLGIISAPSALTELAGRGTYIGYSMGGRFALAAALADPGTVERLVLIGTTAGLETPTECAERLRLDEERARHLEHVGVDAFLDHWLATPLLASLPSERQGLEHRRRNTVAGLAHSLRWSGTGNMGTSIWGALDGLSVPVLILAGEHDHKFRAIGRRMSEHLPNSAFEMIASAGHAAHAERPEVTADAIASWIRATD